MRVVATVATPRPRVESRPTISCGGTHTYKSGEVVTCTSGLWNGGGTLTVTYQWQRETDGVWANIAGQTAATHTVAAGDVDHKIRCMVTNTSSLTELGVSSVASQVSPICIA